MKSIYNEFNFGLGETINMLRAQVNEFASREISKKTHSLTSFGKSLAIWVY